MTVVQIVVWLIIIINLMILVSVVFFERKNTNVVLAWVMVFLFLPYVGFVLYFFFGSTTKMKVLSRKYKLNIIEEEYQREVIKALKRDNALEFDKKDCLVTHENNPVHVLTHNNSVELYAQTNKAFEEMFKDISAAKDTIHIAYYIIKMNDTITKRLIKLLLIKLEEGVKVRIIYDMYGDIRSRYKDYEDLINAGAEVYTYVPSKIKRFFMVNYHYHRKMLIIDGVIAHIGGINIGDEYYGPVNDKPAWRDTTIRIMGSAVTSLQFRFFSDFTFLERQCEKDSLYNKHVFREMFPVPIEKGNVGVQIVSSGPDSEEPYVKDSYYKMINMAKDYLYIQTPYFVPDDTLIEALRISALNGCDVRIMIPLIPDKKFAYYASLSFAEEVMKYGVKVYLYNEFIHSKTIVIDDMISTVGTTNFDIRSFRLDYEVNAFIYDKKFAKKMKETFLEDQMVCKQLDENSKRNKKLIDKILQSIFRLFAPLV